MSRRFVYYGAGRSASLDPDALDFLTATGITDSTITTAIDTVVKDFKSAGLWNKIYYLHPFVGNTSTTHKYNLKDPRDLDVAFRLDFFGGWIHTNTGAKPNGINAYAQTHFTSVDNLNTSDFISYGYYSRTNSAVSAEYVMGSALPTGLGANSALIIRRNTNQSFAICDFPANTSYRGASANTTNDGRGLFMGVVDGPNIKLFRNENIIGQNEILANNSGFTNVPVTIGGINFSGTVSAFTDKECALSFGAKKMNDTEVLNFYNIIQNFQTTLGRQV